MTQARTPRAPSSDRVEPVAAPTVSAVTETPGEVLVPADTSELVLVPEDTYELGPELGSGGSSRVFLARDRRLGREVALKVLQRTEPVAVERFLREGRITARLQHPAIVPLHEMGRLSTGEPFLAMKRSTGLPLDRAIAAATDLEARLALVPSVLAACNAVAYAHASGVIHRDLKPSNVLLGEFDETLVADWGLAKEISDPAERRPGAGDEPPSHEVSGTSGESSGDSAGLTVAGGTLGTPAYMPPEQARGEPADARSDVWALGAMLYQLVSGTPPYPGTSAVDVLDQVRSGPPRPLRVTTPTAPPELASIVDRALAYAPADRYPDASALAEELRAYLAGRRVRAHAYTPRERVSHWMRRHRTLVRVGAASLAVLLAGGAFSFWRIVQEKRRAEALRVVAETRRDAAEELVQFVVFKLRDDLQSVGRLDLLANTGERVQEYYDRLQSVEARPGADARLRAAAALELLGDVARERGDHTRALPLQRRALQLRESVLAESPDDPQRLRAVSNSAARIAMSEEALGHLDPARDASQRSVDLALRAARLRPDEFPLQRNVYRAAAHLGNLLYRRGETEEALAALRLGRDRVAALVERDRSDEALRELANAELTLGNFLDQIRRLDESHAALSRSLALWRELAARHGEDASLRAEFGGALHVLALVDAGRGDRVAARSLLDEAVDTRRKLAEGDPSNRRWRDSFASTLADRCHLSADQGRAAAGITDCETAVALHRALVREQPDNALWRHGLMRSLDELSAAQRRTGRLEAARQSATEAIDLGRSLHAGRPHDAIVRQAWVVAHVRAAEAERTRSPAQARALLDTALAEVRAMRTEQPTNARRRQDEADLLLFRGELEVGMRRLEAADASLAEARAALDPDQTQGTEMGLELPALRARAALLGYLLARARGHPSMASREIASALASLAPLRQRLDSEDTAILVRLERLARPVTAPAAGP